METIFALMFGAWLAGELLLRAATHNKKSHIISIALLFMGFSVFTSLILLLSGIWYFTVPLAASLFNGARAYQGAYGWDYARAQVARMQNWIAGGMVTALLIGLLFTPQAFMLSLNILFFAISLYCLLHTMYAVRTLRYKPAPGSDELPTVTLAIPARNENHALTAALRAATASQYPKLEILVLDDCSQDETAEIIRSFAHAGVRFVKGAEPSDDWLGKNRAYQLLSRQANGKYILFMGVDERLAPDSILQLVQYMEQRRLRMASILPYRPQFDLFASLLQPMRYYRHLALPFMNGQPLPISSAWIIARDELESAGGFAAVSRNIDPETYFARRLLKNGAYRFLLSNKKLGITTRKRYRSQIDTGVRSVYPRLHRNIMVSLALAAGFALFLATSINLIVVTLTPELYFGINEQLQLAAWIALLACHTFILLHVRPHSWWLAPLSLPIALALQSWLFIKSAYEYEFGQVIWKGRSVCIPVLTGKRGT